MKSYKAVLFDLDGTLVDSVDDLAYGVNSVMDFLRKPRFTREEIARMIGKGVRVLLERACEARDFVAEPAFIDQIQTLYERIMTQRAPGKAQFYPGALEAVEQMRASGYCTVLVTNKSEAMTKDFLKKQNIEHLFDLVVTPNKDRRPKPSGDMLRSALEDLGCDRKECLMVGDSRNDALEAAACGMDVALVETGYNEGEPIDRWARENGFDNVQKDVAAVWQWLKSNSPE